MIALHEIELKWIEKMQNFLQGPLLNRFFIAWDAVDSMGFIMLVVLVVWYLIDRKVGIRLLYIFGLSAVINHALKVWIGFPRPCQIISSVGLLCPSSFGLPSGAAQSAILYVGVLFFKCRSRVWRILALCFGALLCFSRVYLGVHFFSDVLGGLAVGGGLLLVYKYLFPIIERDWKRYAFVFPFFIAAIGRAWALGQVAIFSGIFIGLLFLERFRIPKQPNLLFFGLALLGGFVCLKAGRGYPQFVVLFGLIAGIWISFFGAWLAKKISFV